jgi:hypothetical protein
VGTAARRSRAAPVRRPAPRCPRPAGLLSTRTRVDQAASCLNTYWTCSRAARRRGRRRDAWLRGLAGVGAGTGGGGHEKWHAPGGQGIYRRVRGRVPTAAAFHQSPASGKRSGVCGPQLVADQGEGMQFRSVQATCAAAWPSPLDSGRMSGARPASAPQLAHAAARGSPPSHPASLSSGGSSAQAAAQAVAQAAAMSPQAEAAAGAEAAAKAPNYIRCWAPVRAARPPTPLPGTTPLTTRTCRTTSTVTSSRDAPAAVEHTCKLPACSQEQRPAYKEPQHTDCRMHSLARPAHPGGWSNRSILLLQPQVSPRLRCLLPAATHAHARLQRSQPPSH